MKQSIRHLCLTGLWAATGVLAMGQQLTGLDELFRLADRESNNIRLHATAREAAAEGVSAARSQRLPQLNLSLAGSYTGNAFLLGRDLSTHGTVDVTYAIPPYVGQAPLGKQDTPHWGNDCSVQAVQVLYAGGAITAGERVAELAEQMAALGEQHSRQEVRYLLAGHYLDLCRLHNQTLTLDENITLARRVIADMQARLDQGTILPTDLTRYELQLQTLQLRREQTTDAIAIIEHQIATALHLDDTTHIAVDTALIHTPIEALDEARWQAMAADGNAGLRQAELATRISEQELRLARAASRPQVALVAEEHLTGPYSGDLIPTDANVNVWYVGLGVKYDLSSLYRNNHAVRRARLATRQAAEAEALAREGVADGVQAAWTGYQTACTEVRTQRKQAELASQHYAVVADRYANDLALLTDLLDASSMKLTADLGLVNARIALLYRYYTLRYLTHTL